jgi:nicotinamidase-related amidase
MEHVVVLKSRYRKRGLTAESEYVEADVDITIGKAAFLMVDVMGQSSPIIEEHIVPALLAARRAGMHVIYAANSAPRIALHRYEFTNQRLRTNRDDFTVLAAAPNVDPLEYHKGDGPWSTYCESMKPQRGDYLVKKVPYSGFHETRLDPLLRHLGVTDIVACGFSAHMCLRGTLIDAFNRNYRIILLRDCTSGGDLLPSERESNKFSKYMIEWMETYICRSTTAELFVKALR